MHPKVQGLYAILNLPYPSSLSAQDVVTGMIAGGAAWIQLRAKSFSSKERHELAQCLLPHCRRAGVGFVINDDLDVALSVGADLLHVGQEDLAAQPEMMQRAADAGLGLGLSTHNYAQFERAQRQHWSYVALGPVFGTQSKANAEPQVGLEELARCMKVARHPVVAIGGITPQRAKLIWDCNVQSVAVISAIQGDCAQEVQSRCRAFEQPSKAVSKFAPGME